MIILKFDEVEFCQYIKYKPRPLYGMLLTANKRLTLFFLAIATVKRVATHTYQGF